VVLESVSFRHLSVYLPSGYKVATCSLSVPAVLMRLEKVKRLEEGIYNTVKNQASSNNVGYSF